MIDLTKLREEPKKISAAIKKKDPGFDIQELINLDGKFKDIKLEVESLRHKKNELSKSGSKIDVNIIAQSREVGTKLKQKEQELELAQKAFLDLYLYCPNIPFDDVPSGNKEANVVVKTIGQLPKFNFEPRNHVDLGKILNWFDFEAAAKMTGSNFALYKGDAVKLVYSLMMFMMNNNIRHGFSPILPPYLVNEKSLECASNFPRFKEAVYEIQQDNLYLTPTSEVNLTNLYRDHIFSNDQLPIRMTAWTSCFRREAGTYGATERGLIRIHQFEKAELYTICTPENSEQEQDRMISCAEDILKSLDLHYRISLLAAQDCSFASAKTYDIEVWMPGQKAFYEVSSVSNCTDFQARDLAIRYKLEHGGKTNLAYTLNASSLALPRLMVAIMETYQQADGTIAIPGILKSVNLSSLWT